MKCHWKKPSRYSMRQYIRKMLQVAGVALMAGMLTYGLCRAFVWMTSPPVPRPLPVSLEKTEIGQIKSFQFLQGSFTTSNKTVIETTEGFYVVDGTMPFKVAEALYIERRPAGDYLCRYDGNQCLGIVGGSRYGGSQ